MMVPGIFAQRRQAPAAPTWVSIGPTVAADSGAPLAYESEPRTVQMANGNVLLTYRRGSTHSGNDGVIAQRVSSDNGATWGSETTIADDASGFDTRNHSVGIDPVSGRLVLFYSVYNAVAVTRVGSYYKTSVDNGATWSAATDVTSVVGGVGRVPFGRIVSTSNGLMATFYDVNQAVVIFSADGGQTWGDATTVYNLTQTRRYNEPNAVAIDADRIVIAARIDRNGEPGYYSDAFAIVKSSDGGSTWSAASEIRYKTGTTLNAVAAPADMEVFNGKVLTAWISRAPDDKFYYTELPAEDFFADPTSAFSPSTPKEYITTLYKNNSAVSTGTVGEYGYPCLQVLSGINQNALCTWYDMSDGSNTNTRIMAIGTPCNSLPQQDPRLFYTMDSVTGGTLNDGSGFGVNGTIVGAIQRTGQVGQELYFDGNDSVTGVGTTTYFSHIHDRGEFTISFVASLDSPDSGSAYGLMGSTPAASTERGFAVYWEDRAVAALNKAIRFRISRATTGTFAADITVELPSVLAGQRHHWMFVGDGAVVSAYMDNVLIGTSPFAASGTGAATRTLSLGVLNGTTPAFPLSGALDQLRIYRHSSGPLARAALFAETGL